MILIALFFFNCSHENNNEVTKPEERGLTFTNPYGYIGEGHNKICNEYLKAYDKVDYNVIAKMSKEYLISTGHYSNSQQDNSDFLINGTKMLSVLIKSDLMKITDENWIDSLLTAYVNQGAITGERKDKTLRLIDVILNAGGDTNAVKEYCFNLSLTVDDTTKVQTFMTAAVYNASYRLWIGENLGKRGNISKTQLSLLAADAIGAAIGGLIYVAAHTSTETNTWSWEDFGWQALGSGLSLSIGGALKTGIFG
jgi:hypothetical protein